MHEFDLIKHYFATQTEHRSDVIHGIGDDAAVVKVPANHELVITTDTLVAGVHFLESSLPYDIGYKSLAVNLSDLAAMGATPSWISLALTLPKADEDWIQSFCDGLFTLANRHQVQLIGGDLTHGPLTITIEAMGFVPEHEAILRSGAKSSDLIYVTGTLGDAGFALQHLLKNATLNPQYARYILERLHRPEPRLATGARLRKLASAAIDISDGFAADLNHILEDSHVGALVHTAKLPLSEALKHSLPPKEAIALALTSGDDYELCFTIPAAHRAELEKTLSVVQCPYTCVGEITKQLGLDLRNQDGSRYHDPVFGYQHF